MDYTHSPTTHSGEKMNLQRKHSALLEVATQLGKEREGHSHSDQTPDPQTPHMRCNKRENMFSGLPVHSQATKKNKRPKLVILVPPCTNNRKERVIPCVCHVCYCYSLFRAQKASERAQLKFDLFLSIGIHGRLEKKKKIKDI